MLLICKNLLPPGRGLYEAVHERVEGDVLSVRERIRDGSALEAVAAESGVLPSTVTDDLCEEEIDRFATTVQYAALQCGYAPDDPCLHWFQRHLIEEFWPSVTALINFEAEFLEPVGRTMIEHGRSKAFLEIQEHLGSPSHAERKDWTALPMAYVRDFEALSTEDDRSLMVARLEELVVKALDQLDLGKAHSAMRTIAQIQGLTFQDEDRAQRQFALLFAQAHERSDERAIVRESNVTKQLTAG